MPGYMVGQAIEVLILYSLRAGYIGYILRNILHADRELEMIVEQYFNN